MASLMAMDRNLGKLWEMVRDREVWHDTVCGVTKSQKIDWVTKQQFPKSIFLFFFSDKNYLLEVCISRDGSGLLEKTRQSIYVSKAQRKVSSF